MAGTRSKPESDVDEAKSESAGEALGSDHPYAQAIEQGYFGEHPEDAEDEDLTFAAQIKGA